MNRYEAEARERKVYVLVDKIRALSPTTTADHLEQLDPDFWPKLARAAKCKAPSETTIKMVIEAMRHRRAS